MLGTWALALPAFAAEPTDAEILENYANIALAGYEDALTTARALDVEVEALIANPSDDTLAAARDAWRAARPWYQETEAFRFGNPIVDDWEGRVNAWPLDEGLIDYVDASYGTESDENGLYTANVIANPSITIDGEAVDASNITPEFLSGTLQEAGGVEANVATGYHAIEFLLWGQDLHGTDAGAGERPATDFSTEPNAKRRAQYLQSATDLLVADLEEMVGNWKDGGAARAALAEQGISTILTGMGSLSYGEVAGERMKLGLLLHDPEEEHDCFSDNTHNSHYYDEIGMISIYEGSYTRLDGSVVKGDSLSDLVKEASPEADAGVKAAMADAKARLQTIKDTADSGKMAYDQMIADGNTEGNRMIQDGIDGLIAQTHAVEKAVEALKIGAVAIEGSDSLDNPSAVGQ
jgi:putative iron-regulated protein